MEIEGDLIRRSRPSSTSGQPPSHSQGERGRQQARDHHGRQGHPVPAAAQGDVHRGARRLQPTCRSPCARGSNREGRTDVGSRADHREQHARRFPPARQAQELAPARQGLVPLARPALAASRDDDARFRRIAERVLISCAIFFLLMPWLPVRQPDRSQAPVAAAPMAKLLLAHETAKPPPPPPPKAKAEAAEADRQAGRAQQQARADQAAGEEARRAGQGRAQQGSARSRGAPADRRQAARRDRRGAAQGRGHRPSGDEERPAGAARRADGGAARADVKQGPGVGTGVGVGVGAGNEAGVPVRDADHLQRDQRLAAASTPPPTARTPAAAAWPAARRRWSKA